MIFFLIYSGFVYTTGTELTQLKASPEAGEGKLIFQKYNCTACHQFYGLGGYLGPDLTTVISQQGKGEHYARAFLKSGTQRMPDFHLTETEISNLIEYFKYVDHTAITYKQ
jgi:nitric oxide reductase subunit C